MQFGEKAGDYLALKPKRLNILQGSVRSGKTTNTLAIAPRRILQAPPGDILVTGKTERTAYRNVVKPLIQMYGERRVRYTKGLAEGKLGRRTFYVVGANNEAAEGKVRGLTVAYWLADEANLYPEGFVKQMLARMSPEAACCDWTMNPGAPQHYMKTDFIDRAETLDARAWHFTLEDNPNLAPSYIEALKAEYGPGSLYYKRFILGLWVLAEGSIYDFYRPELHTLPAAPGRADWYTVAIDYGTSNPTTFQLHGHLAQPLRSGPHAGLQTWLEAEYYHDSRAAGARQQTDAEYAAAFEVFIKTHLPRGATLRFIIIDPSAASFRLELVRRNYRQIMAADNDVQNGLRTVARLLQAGRFKICHTAQQTLKDIEGYVWDAKAQDRGEDKPLKQNDHSMDALRYALQTVYGRSLT